MRSQDMGLNHMARPDKRDIVFVDQQVVDGLFFQIFMEQVGADFIGQIACFERHGQAIRQSQADDFDHFFANIKLQISRYSFTAGTTFICRSFVLGVRPRWRISSSKLDRRKKMGLIAAR